MEGMKNVLLFCLWVGGTLLCIITVIRSLIRWAASKKEREKLFPWTFWMALFGLALILINALGIDLSGLLEDQNATGVGLLHAAKNIMGSAVILAVLLFGILLIACIGIFIWRCVRAIKAGNPVSRKLENPAFAALITFVILAVYLVAPLVIGSVATNTYADDELASAGQGITQTWKNGMVAVAKFMGVSEEDKQARNQDAAAVDPASPSTAGSQQEQLEALEQGSAPDTDFDFRKLAGYTLLYVIILGIGFAATRILYTIIWNALTNCDESTLWNEYAGAIGLVAVCFSLLLASIKTSFPNNDFKELLKVFSITLCFVVIVVALVALVLEVIRLIIDMRETLIKKSAKVVFIFVVGNMALLLLEIIQTLFCGLETAVGTSRQANIEEIIEKMEQKLVDIMNTELETNVDRDDYMFPKFK